MSSTDGPGNAVGGQAAPLNAVPQAPAPAGPAVLASSVLPAGTATPTGLASPAPITSPPPPVRQPLTTDALTLFVTSRIGGEPIPSTATSELMLRTVTKALGAGATLIDSPGLGLQGAKPVTKTLRGAGLAVYLLSDTLSAHGRKRGLGLAVLALGAALVAIALLSGAAPAWMATAGFGILLGGLAYAALASGMLTLALVLATPVVPLLVWSWTQDGPDGDSGPSRLVQIGLIVGLIATALVMGVVRSPEARPTFARWARVVGGVAALMILAAAIVWLMRTIELPRWLGVAAAVGGAVGVVILAILGLRHVAAVEQAAHTAHDPARAERRAVVAAWAWTYGAGYVVFAIVLAVVLRVVPPADPDTGITLLALIATFVVLAVVCFALCLRTRKGAV